MMKDDWNPEIPRIILQAAPYCWVDPLQRWVRRKACGVYDSHDIVNRLDLPVVSSNLHSGPARRIGLLQLDGPALESDD